jgi:CBS domain containing-hemolysin-like protein
LTASSAIDAAHDEMNDESATELLLVLAAWVCGALAAVVSFMRAVIAAVSASRLEELHPQHPAVLDKVYDARRLGSVERTVLMVADVALVAALAAVLTVLGMVWWGLADARVFLMLAVIVAVIVAGKALVHALGDLMADAVILVVARGLDVVLRIARPLVAVIGTVMETLHARRHQEDAREQVAEELSAIMEEAVEEGTLEAEEVRILQNIMRVRDVHVEDVMTPRNVVAGLAADMPIRQAAELPELQTYSRLPVWEGANMDNIIGYVLSRDVLVAALRGSGTQPIRTLLRQAVFIPENVSLDRALEEFLKRRQHMFIVVDEYGGVEGLLTLEDVLETILGAEIVDEADSVVDMRQLAQQRRDRRIAQQSMQQGVQQPSVEE